MVSYLNTNCGSSWTKMIQLDIEGSQYWTGNYTNNKTWYQSLVQACEATAGVTCVVYSNYYEWQSIFGSTSYCYGASLPLWYAHYDSLCSFSDYMPFGCSAWASPWAKQYEGTHTSCSIGLDSDYMPYLN